jgi:hypothetical protein
VGFEIFLKCKMEAEIYPKNAEKMLNVGHFGFMQMRCLSNETKNTRFRYMWYFYTL